MKRADQLLFKGLLAYSSIVLLLLLGLVYVAQLIAKSSGPGHGTWSMARLMEYAALQLPDVAYDVIPLALLLGTLIWISILSGHSEVIALRMSGWSLWRLEQPLLLVGLIGTLCMFVLGEWVIPVTAPAAEAMWANASQPGVGFHNMGEQGLWLRSNHQLIQIGAVGNDGKSLQGLHMVSLSPGMVQLKTLTSASAAHFVGDQWVLQNVVIASITPDQIRMHHLQSQLWNMALTPSTLSSFAHPTRTMTLPTLWHNYQNLQTGALKMNRFALAFWQRLSYPWVGLIMILLAVPFVTRNPRGGGLAARIMAGLILGLGFHFLTEMSGYISVSGGISPSIATIMPIALFAFIAFFLHRMA
ncbi:LPS export ABC transporter permease LptG [Acidithiobacillus marinus]|uniref:LPS export ABC transporter permease LptG n=1 Tax=Acidithiobacillus marinus TaxID=187490 RepID=A0A2I1DK94_9PROT|nr:LPS export ABC transporter permease LptG [Acidithiobacillus marinus]PKY10298.1 LPS export ABC transporter permease LptG [Acidithiobacillus marinus]